MHDSVVAPIFLFIDPATTEIYTLSLHDALPISAEEVHRDAPDGDAAVAGLEGMGNLVSDHRQREEGGGRSREDRKSTRLNSSHEWISYAVFCLKKKKKEKHKIRHTKSTMRPHTI